MSDAVAIDGRLLRRWPLPALDDAADKEDRGRVVIVAGHREIPGAALLAGEAALRAGAGKLLLATVDSAAGALAIALPEARVVGLPCTAGGDIDPAGAERLFADLEHAAALLIGPGMSDEAAACALTRALLARCGTLPVVLDAGAMAGCQPASGAPLLLTPHCGEMAHLSGCPKEEVAADPVHAARVAAQRWQAVVALKGATTVVASEDGRLWVHEGGCAGLATAGSGDVLAGLIAGLLARGATREQAAAWGVYLHAQAGARLARRVGSIGFLARELAREVPKVMAAAGVAATAARRRTPAPR